jgi:peptide/nickel transport system substrate-binding protein
MMRGQRGLRPTPQIRLAAVVGVLAIGTTIAACGSSSPSGTSSIGAGGSSPHKGGSITVINDVGTGLDPAHNFIYTFPDGGAMEATYGPGLLYVANGIVHLGFATSFTGSHNNMVWTMKLRPGLKFSDGTSFNAQAVVDNMKRIANPTTGSTEETQAKAIKTTAPDATTVVFTLTAPNAQFPSVVADEFSMIPSPTAVAKYGSSYGVHPVGPGPFELVQFTPSVSEKFVPNPYFKIYAPGEPYLDSLSFEEVDANPQALADMETGQADADSSILNGLVIQQMRQAGMTVIATHPVGGAWLELNEDTPPFNNLLAREAVYLALNRTGIANTWAQGNPTSTNFFPTDSPYYNPADNWPAQNKTKAQQLFNQLAAEGHPVSFAVLWPQGTFSAAAQYVAATLNQFKNVHVTADIVTTATYVTDAYETGDYQMTADGFYDSVMFPQINFYFQTGGSLNIRETADPTMDADLLSMQNASGRAAFKAATSKFLQRIISQWDLIPAQQGDIGYAYNAKKIGGVKLAEFGIPAFYGQMYVLNR